ncbi:threonine ammonia-lyase [Actinoallomurus spadix]|uniref:threonine ammonia-lyase n=1 Tax=Actinoallomurus spadix TaxID=79912 RepID=A0ABN0X647_9ACTN|nr:threonine ammonia-lyase [Actinoallomurus spadix]MCO5986927.1 threonine ammonia-lyase [Actinoallomurus spadix]
MSGPVGVDEVRAAQDVLRDVTVTTPILESRSLSAKVGGPVLLKAENLQRAGSFKARGAYVRIARLSAEERARGVVAASAGNHAQGVALAATLLGCRSVVFMPEGAPLPKVAATRAYGAEVVFGGPGVDACLAAATAYARENGAVFIHPFDHPDVVAGQGTVGLEILEQYPDVRTIVVPVGGGGLVAGIAAAVKEPRPDVRVVGAQAERAAAFPPSLAAGRPVSVAPSATMADGIAVGRPGDLTFELVSKLVDSVVTVSEETISRALLNCLERSKQVVEPAGAVGVAALLDRPHMFEPPVVTVLSGGNIDPLLLSKVLRHGLAVAGRYLMFRVRLPDRPGALVTLLGELAELGVNVLDVVHQRTAARLNVDEVEVSLHLETRGPDHCDEVLGRLRAEGYTLSFG